MVGFRFLNETAEAASSESLQKLQKHIFLLRKVVFSTKLSLKSLVSAVSMKLRKQIRRSQCHSGSGFSVANEPAEADSASAVSQPFLYYPLGWVDFALFYIFNKSTP
jgi:hypothetical protein